MKGKIIKGTAVAFSLILVASGFSACGNGGGSDVEYDPETGLIRPSEDGATQITFWGYGDDYEIDVFHELVDQFNQKYDGVINVVYDPKGSDDYSTSAKMALQSSKAKVDVLYVGDSDFKAFAELGFLEPLDTYISNSTEIVLEDMWETSVNRFKYDVNTTTQDGPDAHYYGIPKDIGPTVIYYNETYFNEAGVKVISVAAEELAAFNNGAEDSRGKTKSDYGIVGTVHEKGFFTDDAGVMWFNNQVPMNWSECVELSTIVQTAARVNHNNENIYGYFTEWWFNYGWSVGGDCIEYVESDDPNYSGGYWDFTLMDNTANYIVADNNTEGFDVNGTHYNAGEIIAWADKLVDTSAAAGSRTIRSEVLTAAKQGKLNELPSQRDAFVEFVRVGQKTSIEVEEGLYGYGICPMPTSLGGDSGKVAAFAKGTLAMLVDGRWDVVSFRDQMDGVYDWDVAPMPMYKEYYEEGDDIPAGKEVGDVKVHGVEAAHSGSVALCINAKSTKKNAAWVFAEFIGGATGQTAQAETGFAIPSQISLANSEVFLQSNQNPRNSIVFVRAAAYETPGDWWYLRDKAWIDDWALVLNGSVRNGQLTLSQFEQHADYLKTWELLKEYTEK